MNDERTYPATPKTQDLKQPCERLRPARDLAEYLRQFTRERPEVVALGCLSLGFVLGWKLKPW